jgi:hypothetical protein
MSPQPAPPLELDPDDLIGARHPNMARIWNYELGSRDNFAIDRQACDAADARVQALGVPPGMCAA